MPTTTSLNGKGQLSHPSPCPHCGKQNENKWCYEYLSEIGVLYGVCKREAPPASGWEETEFKDRDGVTKYRVTQERKTTRKKQQRNWVYSDQCGFPVVRVCRTDDGNGNRRYWQQHWDGQKWEKGLGDINRDRVPIYNYQAVRNEIENGHGRIWIVEGESCADVLNEMGLVATCNLGGAGKWSDYHSECLKNAMELILCPDRDIKGIKHMKQVRKSFYDSHGDAPRLTDIGWMYANPGSPFWERLPENNGLDVADWVNDDGVKLKVLVNSVGSERELLGNSDSDSPHNRGSESDSKSPSNSPDKLLNLNTKQLTEFVREDYKDRLKFNELRQKVELDGEDYPTERAYLMLANDNHIKAPRTVAADIFEMIAEENSYNPVQVYLEQVKTTAKPINLDNLSSRYFGTSDPLYDISLKRTLIAAVARIYQPGCKVDTALILKGDQGIGKSTFFKILAGQWFDDSMGDGHSKDDLLILHKCWIQEWGEFGRISRRREADELKAFLSRSKDDYRKPYGRDSLEHKRRSIIVGSVNDDQFLLDATGNRRYWVIPIAMNEIDLERLRRERDGIWASAIAAYERGEQWWLTRDEERMSAENNSKFQVTDEWESLIADYLEFRDRVSVGELLKEAIGLDADRWPRGDQMRVAAILTSLGWDKVGVKHHLGRRQQCWETITTSQPQDRGCDEVVTSETPTQQGMSQPSQRSQPFSQKNHFNGDEAKTTPSVDINAKCAEKVVKVVTVDHPQSQQGLQSDQPQSQPHDQPQEVVINPGDWVQILSTRELGAVHSFDSTSGLYQVDTADDLIKCTRDQIQKRGS